MLLTAGLGNKWRFELLNLFISNSVSRYPPDWFIALSESCSSIVQENWYGSFFGLWLYSECVGCYLTSFKHVRDHIHELCSTSYSDGKRSSHWLMMVPNHEFYNRRTRSARFNAAVVMSTSWSCLDCLRLILVSSCLVAFCWELPSGVEAEDSFCQALTPSPTLTQFVDKLPIPYQIPVNTTEISIGAWKIKQVFNSLSRV